MNPKSDDALDRDLRTTLEPSATQVASVLDRARSTAQSPNRRRPMWVPWGVAASVALAAVLALVLTMGRPHSDHSPIATASTNTTTHTPAIRISNLEGPLTVTTTAGGHWVVLDRVAFDRNGAQRQENDR